MSELVKVSRNGSIGIITIDNPPVNALGPAVAEGIAGAIAAVESDASLEAAVLIGSGSTFIAGADIREFVRIVAGERSPDLKLHAMLSRIENCRKPVICAIHGHALGGGLETAMACHYRIAVRNAKLGQPEVNLGLIPGAGGTQRLPRLAGVEKALEMCTGGKPIPASEALEFGIVDALVEGDLLSAALAFAHEAANRPIPRTGERTGKLGSAEQNARFFALARQTALRLHPGQDAPLTAIEAIEASTRLSFSEGCETEQRLFVERLFSEQSKALIHLFFAEREVAKVPGITRQVETRPIRTVGLAGSVQSLAALAPVFANAGVAVLLKAKDAGSQTRTLAAVRRSYTEAIQKGRLTPPAAEECLGRIRVVRQTDDFAEVDLALAAGFEGFALRDAQTYRELFAELDRDCPGEALRVSGSPRIALDELTDISAHPEMVLGLQFPAPGETARALEIVRSDTTSAEAIATAMQFAKRLGRVAIVTRDYYGAGGHRMLGRYQTEAHALLREGISAAVINAALERFGMAGGPLLDDEQQGSAGESLSPEEIVQRCLYAAINEGARLLEKRAFLRPEDIDVLWVHGYGFSAYRGGPMWYADSIGLARVYERIRDFQRQHGARWEPTSLLRDLAQRGGGFFSQGRGKDAAA